MRRLEAEEYSPVGGRQLPFRVLYETPGLGPPPSRAPEPYKIAPQPRAQRKSSFAIIAEPPGRPAATPPEDLSALPATGRLSPFRGRGFKGPLPRARSTPPPNPNSPNARSRRDKAAAAASVSQQNSPRRSQIPRPSRSRSNSASNEKLGSNKSSPKFGRRAANRYTSSVGNNNPNHRRPAQKHTNDRPKLSPIQGTPTKQSAPDKNKVNGPKAAPRRNLLAAPRPTPTGKRFINSGLTGGRNAEKAASTEALDSPSKIPLRRGSNSSSTPSLASLAPKPKPTAKPQAASQQDANTPNGATATRQPVTSSKADMRKKSMGKKEVVPMKGSIDGEDEGPTNKSVEKIKASQEKKLIANKAKPISKKETISISKADSKKEATPKNNKKEANSTSKSISEKKNVTENKSNNPESAQNGSVSGAKKEKAEEESGLAEMLRQNGTGTASVVSTTTTTVVQPLQIDAGAVLKEAELHAKLSTLERKQRQDEAATASTAKETTSTPKPNHVTQTMIKHFGPDAQNGTVPALTSPANNSTSTSTSTGTSNNNIVSASVQVEQAPSQQSTNAEEKESESAGHKSGGHKKTDSKASVGKSSTGDSKRLSPTSSGGGESKASARLGANGAAGPTSIGRAGSVESVGSVRSTDTGVSVNTVRGVSSAKEKSGLHVVKRPDHIETLSGNIVHLDTNGQHALANESSAGVGGGGEGGGGGGGGGEQAPQSKWQRIRSRCWPKRLGSGKLGRSKVVGCCCGCDWLPEKMRCLACRREPKGKLWPGKLKAQRAASTAQLTPGDKPDGKWAKIKNACRCSKLREGWRLRRSRVQQQQQQQTDGGEAGTGGGSRGCGAALADQRRRLGSICRGLFSRCCCCSSCGSCSSCSSCRRNSDSSLRGRKIKAKHSLTSVAPPPISEKEKPKLPDVLVEHGSMMRGAIPCLPIPLAWFCLVFNVILPGSGSAFSGLFNLCVGQPRFNPTTDGKERFGAFVVNVVVGMSQLFTVLFCLVGWGWSIWWGVTMLRIARKYKRFKESEAAAHDPEARAGPENASLPAPGVLRAGPNPR